MKKILFLLSLMFSLVFSPAFADTLAQDQEKLAQDKLQLKQDKAQLQVYKDQLDELKKVIQIQRQKVIEDTRRLEADENALRRHREQASQKNDL